MKAYAMPMKKCTLLFGPFHLRRLFLDVHPDPLNSIFLLPVLVVGARLQFAGPDDVPAVSELQRGEAAELGQALRPGPRPPGVLPVQPGPGQVQEERGDGQAKEGLHRRRLPRLQVKNIKEGLEGEWLNLH